MEITNTELFATTKLLTPVQALETSGARAVETFCIGGTRYLAVPQLARDVEEQKPAMNAGDSNVDMLIYRWQSGKMVQHDSLLIPGGEDAEYFELGGASFLATCGVRSGAGPYSIDTKAVIHRCNAGKWEPFQVFDVFAAKQWHFFSIDSRHFLALAQGVTLEALVPKNPRESRIYEWDGELFVLLQTLDGVWGYNWASTSYAGEHYLAYADHVGGSPIFKWQSGRFEVLQTLPDPGGRAFAFFEESGTLWMIFANLMGSTALYQLDADQFIERQILGGPGGRELRLIDGAQGKYLVRVCFITGTPHDPTTALMSQIYKWKGSSFALADEFPTTGGTDATVFEEDGIRYLAVSNSLTEHVRFRADSVIYRFNG